MTSCLQAAEPGMFGVRLSPGVSISDSPVTDNSRAKLPSSSKDPGNCPGVQKALAADTQDGSPACPNAFSLSLKEPQILSSIQSLQTPSPLMVPSYIRTRSSHSVYSDLCANLIWKHSHKDAQNNALPSF